MQEALGDVQKQLEEAQQKSQLTNFEEKHTGGGEQPGTLGNLADGTLFLSVHLFMSMH